VLRSSGRTRGLLGVLVLAVLALGLGAAPGVAEAAEAPTVLSIDDASAVSYTTAQVVGSVERAADPDPASNANCSFEYVIDAQYRGTGFKDATQVPCDIDSITAPGPNPVSAELIDLKPGAMYHLQLTADNSAGSSALVAANTFTTTAVTPPSVTISAPTLVTPRSAHFSAAINPQVGAGDPALYEVEWHFQCTPECLGADGEPISGAPIPPDSSLHPVAGDAVLEPNTTYQVSLVATNAGESASAGPVTFTTGALAPLARTLGVSVKTDSAQLGAKINPLNSSVTYQFQWGPNSSYENLAPASAEPLSAADNTYHFVAESIAGLQAASTYHYRIVAVNTETDEESFGVDRTFTTLAIPVPPPPCGNESSRVGPSANLPDCRAYELATPGLNNSAPSGGWPGIVVEGVLADGSALAFAGGDAPDNAEGATATSDTFLARRDSGSWSTKSLAAPTPLSTGTDFGTSRSTVGISSDLSQSVLWTNQPLLGSASPSGTNLYLRRADGSFVALTKVGAPTFTAGGELSGASKDFTHLFIVSTVKQLDPEDPVSGGNTYEWVNGQLRLVAILPGPDEEPAPDGGSLPEAALPVVSEDGSEVLFTANGLPGLYLRSDGQQSVEVSASQRTVDPDPNPTAPAIAVGMAADGSEVLFTSRSELTNDANTGRTGGVANDHGSDLYSYDVASGELTDLSVDEDPADAATGANVEGVVGASRDASYVYFIAKGDLAEGATSGERNLYVEHDGTIDFLGSNPSGDPEQGYPFYVTPDGQYAAFVTTEGQTGYDNAGQSEVYKYTYGGGLECASCRPSGEAPSGDASIAGRAISNDGSHLFFQSNDAVVTQAQSGQSNVFEYVAGEPHLLTPGDGVASLLVGASASGDDVFIASFEELAPRGQGAVFGIYDARVNANVPPPAPPAGCQGESCRGATPPTPIDAGAGSATFEAPGKVAISGAKSVKGAKAQLRILVPGGGELTISGRGLKAVKKQVSKAGPVGVTLVLTPAMDKKRKKKGAFRTEVEVLFKSSAGEVSRAEASLKFEVPATRGGGK
jgi:hypothetical protein